MELFNRFVGKVTIPTIKTKLHEVKIIDINGIILDLLVPEDVYINDTACISYMSELAITSSFMFGRTPYSLLLNFRIHDLKAVREMLLSYCDIVYIDHLTNKGLIRLKMFGYKKLFLPVADSEGIHKLFSLCSDDYNLLSNRYLIERLIDDLSYGIERLEYYEQEIAKSKN